MGVSHLDVRDDRVLLYVGRMSTGTSVYSYAARAVTRGDFRVPVIAADSMYDPGIYSRNGAGRLVIAAAKP